MLGTIPPPLRLGRLRYPDFPENEQKEMRKDLPKREVLSRNEAS